MRRGPATVILWDDSFAGSVHLGPISVRWIDHRVDPMLFSERNAAHMTRRVHYHHVGWLCIAWSLYARRVHS